MSNEPTGNDDDENDVDDGDDNEHDGVPDPDLTTEHLFEEVRFDCFMTLCSVLSLRLSRIHAEPSGFSNSRTPSLILIRF